MSDELMRFLKDLDAGPEGPRVAKSLGGDSEIDPFDEESFDEEAYLRLNPDVAESVRSGHLASGFVHFTLHGFREGRPTGRGPMEPRNRLLRAKLITSSPAEVPANSCEAVISSDGGGIFVIGWLDDTASPLTCIRVSCGDWRVLLDRTTIVRFRRPDVEAALGKPVVHAFGFMGFISTGQRLKGGGPAQVELFLEDNGCARATLASQVQSDLVLRDTLLGQLAHAEFFGNPAVERVACLDDGMGEQILAFNRIITASMTANPYCETFGPRDRKFRGSIVVCLYGKPEYLFAQNALYAGLPGIEDYEFIYVSNSPELGEVLLREAQIGSQIHGISQTVMVLRGNAGFGAANNAAVTASRSDRVLNVNPDVFPRDPAWAHKHTQLISGKRRAQTRMFGVPLYYDDGSLMHGGMYFDLDSHIATAQDGFARRRLARVEHYGKGAPPDSVAFTQARPVPAVTGAFISSERSWYEKLGGFDEAFVYGHYEDADLCLRSLAGGTAVWMHDLRLWHLEGKGSTRKPPHEGGSVVNRWMFTRRWGRLIEESMLGPTPSHPMITNAA